MKEFNVYCPYCEMEYNNTYLNFQCFCGKPLSISYNLDKKNKITFNKGINSIWRYSALLPIDIKLKNAISFGEGITPMFREMHSGKNYFIKLESVNPSGSFKDRGASLLISYLKSIEIEEFVEDSSGNAGLSYSMYAAKGALKANIYVPNYLNENRLFHLKLLNAQIHVIYGSRKDVSDAALVAAQNIFYASHAWNPFFLHGIKTIAYELYEQLNNRILPPIFIPAGNGTLLLGVFLGLRDLLALELIDKIPHLYVIQPANCAPLSYFKEKQTLEGFKPHYSVAEGTLIENPPRLLEMLNAIEESQGDIITVSDETILNAFRILNCKGYFIEPTAALAFAAFIEKPLDNAIVILTGSALKIGRSDKFNL